ncbi:MAG: response regulator transcription factor [Candidatus Bipolaricaulota bacterium]|nr:response regulator transcription factor [Candidatus Bipolaricaulota bacterium]
MRILICEDEPDITTILSSSLIAEGYDVSSASTGEELLRMFPGAPPDLVLLDVKLPGMNGWEVLDWIRTRSNCPVIMLTAYGRVADKVRGLSRGADDYIAKPFKLVEVRARIEAVLRRSSPVVEQRSFEIDDMRKVVILRGKEITLSPKEYALVGLLFSEPGRVFSRQQILSRLWPDNRYATFQDVQKYIYLLRKKLEDDPSHPKFILTVRGFGYRLAS